MVLEPGGRDSAVVMLLKPHNHDVTERSLERRRLRRRLREAVLEADPSMSLSAIFEVVIHSFGSHHTYQFDQFRSMMYRSRRSLAKELPIHMVV